MGVEPSWNVMCFNIVCFIGIGPLVLPCTGGQLRLMAHDTSRECSENQREDSYHINGAQRDRQYGGCTKPSAHL